MSLDKYQAVSTHEHLTYEFLSQGPMGTIKKVVVFQKLEAIGDNVFNLGFGDWDEGKQRIDDRIRSNNSDRDKVLGTVAFIIIDFVKFYPEANIFLKGNTISRTRLYQIAITLHFNEIDEIFEIQGFRNRNWEDFMEGRNYQAFVLKSKLKL